MEALTWLHLSDWHQKGKEFGRVKVRDALMKDIKERVAISPDLAKIDFIVFSGDVTFHGTTNEYQDAITEFFTPLLEAANVDKERLFIVPGNHDLEWAALELLPSDLPQRLNAPNIVDEWLTDERKRRTLMSPFENYSQFISHYLGQDVAGSEPAFGFVRRFQAGGQKIVVIGLNSAWLCARIRDANGEPDDRGHLILGEPQVYEALAKSQDAEICIAVFHHPFDWLVEFDQHRIEERIGRQCHFVLRGHQHFPQVQVMRGTIGDCVVIPAGASYDRDVSSDPLYTNAYNFVHLDLETNRGIAYLRRWSTRRGEWVDDTDSWDGGQFAFDLPKVPTAKAPSASSELTEIERRRIEAERAEIRDLLILFERRAFRPPDVQKGDPTAALNAIQETRIALQMRGASLIADADVADQFRDIQDALWELEQAVKAKYPAVARLTAKWKGESLESLERREDVQKELGAEDYEKAVIFIRNEAAKVYFATESIRAALQALNAKLAKS